MRYGALAALAVLLLAVASPALASSPAGPSYTGVQGLAVSLHNLSDVFGLLPPGPVNLTAVLGWLYIRSASFYTPGAGPYASAQLNVDLLGLGGGQLQYLWAQDVAALEDAGQGGLEVSLRVNLWNFTSAGGYRPGLGSPLSYEVVYGSAETSQSPQGPFLLSSTPWAHVGLPANVTLAVAAQGRYVGFYYSLGGPLTPLLIVELPVNVTAVVWPQEGMDAEFVLGGYMSGSEAHVTAWDGASAIRYYYGPWSPAMPPGEWYCFPAVWPEGYQTAEAVSDVYGVRLVPNATLWAYEEVQGQPSGSPMVASALLRPYPGDASAYLWPPCANWTVVARYYYGGSWHVESAAPHLDGTVRLEVPQGASYVNLTAVAWVGGFPAFENTTAYGSPPTSGAPLPTIPSGPLGLASVLAIASSLGALVAAAGTRRRAPDGPA